VTRAAILLALLLAMPSAAAAQAPPDCAPDKVANVTLRTQERGEEATPVATHEIDVSADILASDPTQIVITPQDGVEVLGRGGKGSIVVLLAPSTPNLSLTISWRQSADESNPEESARCSASRVMTLPVLAANPARGVKQPNPGPDTGHYTFAVAPALKRPNLSPIEIAIRSTGQARFPRANERLRTWVLPMRGSEQLKYRTHLPNYAYATFPQLCKFWWMTCGPVNSQLSLLQVKNGGRPDLDGRNAILGPLAFSQPARWAARYGFTVSTFPGAAKNRPFGYDVQVRQAGRLLARVRKAGRCREVPRNGGSFHSCTKARGSVLLR
jgi:hypothetical protein